MLLRSLYARKEPSTMENTTITVGSITYAIKARRILLHSGIRSRLVKVITEQSARGCTHGISLPSARFFDAVVALKRAGIEYSVYRGGKSE